jgi:exopolysaccharide production protein ExoZ
LGTGGHAEGVDISPYMRGAAVLMIVFVHLQGVIQRIGYSGYWPTPFLAPGVDIFFIISGFIMWVTTARGMRTADFYRRRVIRIVPLYWVLTTIVLAVLLVAPKAVQTGRFETWHVVASYLFIPAVHPVEHVLQPLLIPGWTLNYEMFFYALFGAALALPPLQRFTSISLVLCAAAAIPLVISVDPFTPLGFYTSDIMLEFVFGMALGWAYVNGLKLSPFLLLALVTVGVIGIATFGSASHRSLSVGIPALCLVGGAVMFERLWPVPSLPALHLIGNASYSIYLVHPLALSAVGQLWRKLPLPAQYDHSAVALGLVAVMSSTLIGIVIYLLIEKPLLKLGGLRIFNAAASKPTQPVTT